MSRPQWPESTHSLSEIPGTIQYEEMGVECVTRLRGMFAFAVWDEPRQRLFLARDRLGQKPLFYHQDESTFRFASEPKAILQDHRVSAEPNLEALHFYLTYGFTPSPSSAFQGIRKLSPAHRLVLQDGACAVDRYWTLSYRNQRNGDDRELTEELIDRLNEAVRLRMRSDVRLGVLLSGGLDSSTVVALMSRRATQPVRTFSIGFKETNYDERRYAREVASYFGTDHQELIVEPDVLGCLPQLVWHYGEPFADSSALPTFQVCRLARQSVTVALSGDGADEAFGGYERYKGVVLSALLDHLPLAARQAVGVAAHRLPDFAEGSKMRHLQRFAREAATDPRRRYAAWLTFFDHRDRRALYSPEFFQTLEDMHPVDLFERAYDASDAPSFAEASMNVDQQLYLPDDLLVKIDIASMAHSLEVRSPFLDHEVVEFAASLPLRMKIRGRTGKFMVRSALQNVLPSRIIKRRKKGFGMPLAEWFRKELRDLSYDVLLDGTARARGLFKPSAVRMLLEQHISGRRNHHFRLWNLLMLELWYRTFIDTKNQGWLNASRFPNLTTSEIGR